MPQSDRDVADHPFSVRHARWRTWLRIRTPNVLYYRLGLVVPKAKDCGNHEWHNSGDGIDACYHCEITRSTPLDAPWSTIGSIEPTTSGDIPERSCDPSLSTRDLSLRRMSAGMDQEHDGGTFHADLGYSIKLRGDPEDSELMRAAADGKWDRVRSILLARPYRRDPHVVDRIVADLESGRAAP